MMDDDHAAKAPGRRHLSSPWVWAEICAVLVLALSATWVVTTRGGPAAHGGTGAALAPGGGKADRDAPSEGADDGAVPDDRSLTPFDTGFAAVRNLDKRLLGALRAAAGDARDDGVEFRITSGWRSEAHQRRLLEEAVRKYGSLERARVFVNTPEKSTHVSGKAVDIGPTDADDWLIQHGAAYGLCQVYANEMWHFELLVRPGGTCPALLTDAAG